MLAFYDLIWSTKTCNLFYLAYSPSVYLPCQITTAWTMCTRARIAGRAGATREQDHAVRNSRDYLTWATKLFRNGKVACSKRTLTGYQPVQQIACQSQSSNQYWSHKRPGRRIFKEKGIIAYRQPLQATAIGKTHHGSGSGLEESEEERERRNSPRPKATSMCERQESRHAVQNDTQRLKETWIFQRALSQTTIEVQACKILLRLHKT